MFLILRKFALTKKDYLKFLHQLSDHKQIDKEKLMESLLNAGLPAIPTKPKKLNLITSTLEETAA